MLLIVQFLATGKRWEWNWWDWLLWTVLLLCRIDLGIWRRLDAEQLKAAIGKPERGSIEGL